MKIVLFFLLFSLFSCQSPVATQQDENVNDLTIVTWNIQNLFDDHSDGTEYAEFVPSDKGWNRVSYQERLIRQGELLAHIINETDADIVILQEIENQNVLEDLLSGPLADYPVCDYRVTRGPDQAIQIGVFSRYPITGTSIYSPGVFQDRPLRQILEVRFDAGGTPLTVFCCHWKSKSGGEEATEPGRIRSASMILQRLEVLDGDVVLAGDLNEDWFEAENSEWPTALGLYSDESVFHLTGDPAEIYRPDQLFSPWMNSEESGSYYFRENWSTPDHFLLTSRLFDGENWEYSNFSVYRDPAAVDDSGQPVKWNIWDGQGYSDHLPLVLKLQKPVLEK